MKTEETNPQPDEQDDDEDPTTTLTTPAMPPAGTSKAGDDVGSANAERTSARPQHPIGRTGCTLDRAPDRVHEQVAARLRRRVHRALRERRASRVRQRPGADQADLHRAA